MASSDGSAQSKDRPLNDVQMRLIGLFRELGLRPGQVIPAEAAVSQRLGISRSVVREALQALQALGVVQGRQGARRRLQGLDPSVLARHVGLALGPDVNGLRELLDVRQVLERAALPSAVLRASADDMAELHALVDQMYEHAREQKTFFAEDQQFHRVLVVHYGNRTLEALLEAFWLFFSVNSTSVVAPDDLENTAELHAAILRAVEDKNIALATHRLDAHFLDVRDRLDTHIVQSGNTQVTTAGFMVS